MANKTGTKLKLKDVVEILKAEIICGADKLDTEATSACASDMMSDVLAFVKDQSVLVTGLCNPQVIRTAEMMDMICVVFVRGKKPDPMMIEMANAKGIVLLCAPLRMYLACGMLYAAGLGAGEHRI